MKKTLLFLLLVISPLLAMSQTVFINEIHYDNDGTDANEGVEIAGPAGTDLTGYTILAYNGSSTSGAVYSTTELSGTITDQSNGYGTLWFAISGLQNGAPDGIALVDASSVLIQFLSYEGSFTATDGAALDLTSTDIGVVEASDSEVGYSLQLTGANGTEYTDFTWAESAAATMGAVNNGQSFGEDLDAPGWTTDFPFLDNILDTQGTLHVSLDEACTVYFVILADGATAPTSEEVKAGVDYGLETVLHSGSFSVSEAGTEVTEILDGATPETSYDIYVVAEDASSNLQASPAFLEATMTAARSLVLTSPTAGSTVSVGDQVTFQWTSANISSVIFGGYDYSNDEYFFIEDEDTQNPVVVDATDGSYLFTIPVDAATNQVKLRIFDYADTTFYSEVSPIYIEDDLIPGVEELSPLNGATNVATDAALEIDFDETVYSGTGNLVIRTIDGTVFESFDVATSTSVEVTDNRMIVTPSAEFSQQTKYYVEMDAGVVTDFMGNASAAISGSETWSFTTAAVPVSVFYDDFSDGDLSPWTVYDESGDTETWELSTTYQCAVVNGYGSAQDQIDWLISPALSVDGYTDPTLDFNLYYSYGTLDETNYLGLYYSTDYDGNTENLLTATWTQLSFTAPSSSSTFEAAGPVSLTGISGAFYIAFKYVDPNDGAYRQWEVDDVNLAGYVETGSDATLSDLTVDGETIEGFSSSKTEYTLVLPVNTTLVPTVGYTTTVEGANVVLTNATDLTGDATARTTTVVVTSTNGEVSKTYSIRFDPIIGVSDLASLRAVTDYDRTYCVTGEAVITAVVSSGNQKFLQDATGGIQVYDSDGIITTTYSVGDGVTNLTGTLYSYYEMLELIPTEDPGAATSTGNTVDPQVLTVSEFTTNFESYEAELVKIEGLAFSAADGSSTFANGSNYVVTSGEESTVVRTHFYSTTVTGSVIPYMADVQGIAIWHYSEAKIVPRSLDDLTVFSSVATLSDLKVDGTTVDNFDAATLSYTVNLTEGTTTVPDVTATPTESNASVTIIDATNLGGTEAERTTTVSVVSHDQSASKDYTIIFSVADAIGDVLGSDLMIYPSPVSDFLNLKNIQGVKTLEVLNVTGSRMIIADVEGMNSYEMNVSELPQGIYFIRLRTDAGTLTKKFVKK